MRSGSKELISNSLAKIQPAYNSHEDSVVYNCSISMALGSRLSNWILLHTQGPGKLCSWVCYYSNLRSCHNMLLIDGHGNMEVFPPLCTAIHTLQVSVATIAGVQAPATADSHLPGTTSLGLLYRSSDLPSNMPIRLNSAYPPRGSSPTPHLLAHTSPSSHQERLIQTHVGRMA